MSTNRAGGFLVTRGFGGPPTHVLVRGFLPSLAEEIAAVARGARLAGRRARDKVRDFLEDLQISAALVAINGKDLVSPILNTVRTSYKDEPAPTIEVTPTKLSVKKPDIKVNVKHIRSKDVDN